MSRVFVSYRHEDSEADAGRLYDTLVAELGSESVYKDVENIGIGRNWKRAVEEALADSAAVLFVMGPNWRLTPPIEFELRLVLGSKVPVVPILVRKADLLQLTDALPTPLSEIGERIAVTLSHASWARDCRELIEKLKEVLTDPARARVVIEPPDPRALLDERNWPFASNRDQLLNFAQDLAECLRDPEVRKNAEQSYGRFDEERFDGYYRMHQIPPALTQAVQSALQRLSVEQYVRDLLERSPGERDWEGLAATITAIGMVLGDPSLGERAKSEVDDIRNEISELSRTKGDSGSPAVIRSAQETLNEMVSSAKKRLLKELPGIDQPGFTRAYPQREWPIQAFGKTKQYGRE